MTIRKVICERVLQKDGTYQHVQTEIALTADELADKQAADAEHLALNPEGIKGLAMGELRFLDGVMPRWQEDLLILVQEQLPALELHSSVQELIAEKEVHRAVLRGSVTDVKAYEKTRTRLVQEKEQGQRAQKLRIR